MTDDTLVARLREYRRHLSSPGAYDLIGEAIERIEGAPPPPPEPCALLLRKADTLPEPTRPYPNVEGMSPEHAFSLGARIVELPYIRNRDKKRPR
jgi:hypothetical protein